MSPLLDVQDLAVAYDGVQAVRGVSFSLCSGTVTALLGANGAGKTTILRAISGSVRSRGRILFDGHLITGDRPERAAQLGVAHVPDDRGTFKGLTVYENLTLGAVTRADTREIARDIDKTFAYFPRLAERVQQQAGTMSGGEQQMLAIARALMLRPKLMLLDEPSFGLAPAIVKEVFATLKMLKRQENVAMLLVEQNAELALALADEAHLVRLGRIVTSGPSGTLRADGEIRQAYLGH